MALLDAAHLEANGFAWAAPLCPTWPSGEPQSPIRDILKTPSWLKDLARSDELRAIASEALGAHAFVVRANLFAKTAGSNWSVPWHQDRAVCVRAQYPADGFSGWSIKGGCPHANAPVSVLRRMVGLRIHLDDCSPTAGPLEVIPESHRSILAAADLDAVTKLTPRTLSAKAGDVLVMRPLLVHRSRSQRASSLARRVLHVELAADPLPGPLEWRYAD